MFILSFSYIHNHSTFIHIHSPRPLSFFFIASSLRRENLPGVPSRPEFQSLNNVTIESKFVQNVVFFALLLVPVLCVMSLISSTIAFAGCLYSKISCTTEYLNSKRGPCCSPPPPHYPFGSKRKICAALKTYIE